MQARFLIPMAVSLAFGVVFATFITLMLIPSGYMILEDLKRLASLPARRRSLRESRVRASERPGDLKDSSGAGYDSRSGPGQAASMRVGRTNSRGT